MKPEITHTMNKNSRFLSTNKAGDKQYKDPEGKTKKDQDSTAMRGKGVSKKKDK